MLAAFLFTIVAVFSLETVVNHGAKVSASREKLEEVREKLERNEENITRLTENLSAASLVKTRAFADLLAEDPSIAESKEMLNAIRDRLMVNELHIIDENGIITSSTIDAYVGFDMKSGEQSLAFMEIVRDPSLEIVQEPQMNAAEGIMMQYIGVARRDAAGLVQAGIRPEVLEDMLSDTAIDVVLREIEFGDSGYIYAIDADSGDLLAHPDAALTGTAAVDAGFSAGFTGSGKAKVNGVKGYYLAEENGGRIIGTFLPAGEYYANRQSQTMVVSLSMLVIFGILLIMISRMVDQKIVSGIDRITRSTQAIAGGDFGITIQEEGNPEFVLLSESINKMVENISRNMKENEHLLRQQEGDMENSRAVIQNIKNACVELHESLLAKGGFYANLYNSQFAG